jgi:hypothetical protein
LAGGRTGRGGCGSNCLQQRPWRNKQYRVGAHPDAAPAARHWKASVQFASWLVQPSWSWFTCELLSVAVCRVVFDPLVRPRPHGLFTQDPEFWQTVHLGGDGWEEYLAQRAAAAKQEWADKVVVEDIHFHALPGTGDKAAAQVRSKCCGRGC